MARNIIITFYKLFFQCFFYFFSLLPIHRKCTFISSFGDNNKYVSKEILKLEPYLAIIYLKTKNCKAIFKTGDNTKTYIFESYHLLHEIRNIYHIATSKIILVDNYFGFLSFVKFRKNVECIQLWHAAGSLKKFGLLDPSNHFRDTLSLARFNKVYQNFHKIVIGSEKQATIFKKTFGLSEENFLKTGIPRTDLFFNEPLKQEIRHLLSNQFNIENKKVILYAPTFRKNKLDSFNWELDIEQIRQAFSDTHILLLKSHQSIVSSAINEMRDGEFVFDCSKSHNINELLLVTDYLITDYSSIPFEFALLEKPMIFYPYDFKEYEREHGILFDYEQFVPGQIAHSTTEIIELIKNNFFDRQKIRQFKKDWNEFSDGYSSANLAEYMLIKLNN